MIPGQAWLLAATNNSVVAWKIVDQGGKPTLQPGWTSRTLSAPATPVIVNNVVFAVSSGKPAAAGGRRHAGRAVRARRDDRQGYLEQRHDASSRTCLAARCGRATARSTSAGTTARVRLRVRARRAKDERVRTGPTGTNQVRGTRYRLSSFPKE